MFESLRDTLFSVQTELTNRVGKVSKLVERQIHERNSSRGDVEKLRVNVAPTLGAQKCSTDAIQELVNTRAGSDLLLKYQLSLDQMHEVSEEGVRLANLCSTRMGRAQQMCKERADAVLNIDTFLRSLGDMEKKMRELNRQVDKLHRFCDQTELAFTHLDALSDIVRAEEEVDLIRQQARIVSNIVPSATSPGVIPPPAVQASDTMREKQEEVMLEEFLASKP